MALRSEATIGAFLMLVLAAVLPAAEVRHRHAHGGAAGALNVTDTGLSFEEQGKGRGHSRQWRFDDIQQLTLSADTLRIVTYEDDAVKFGRDRRFVFDGLPKGLAAELYPMLSRRLDQRFVAALADDAGDVLWRLPVKLLHRVTGSQGELAVLADRVVYRTAAPEESRTWRIRDLEMVASSDAFDLTIETREREFRFQLKRAMTGPQFDGLWRAVNLSKRDTNE